jgi:ribonucleoside-diphosphate reductase alpha chain
MEADEYYVVKRDGRRQEAHFDKITERNRALCAATAGPTPRRALARIEPQLAGLTLEVLKRFQSGSTTHELDMLTASVCAARSARHPEYADLAARIVVSDLHKRTPESFAEAERAAARTSEELRAIAARASAEIDGRIDHARDYQFTCFGVQTMIRSYLLRTGGADSPIAERPQHAYMRVALALCVGAPDRRGGELPEEEFRARLGRAFEVYDLLSAFRLTHASPTMFNAGTAHPQLSSCFLLAVDDDLETILQVDKDAGMISKWAGGIGICLSRMRAEGALIRSSGGESSGLRRLVAKLNASQLYVNQGGLRPGAYALYLEAWHADVFAFIEMGRFKGVALSAPDVKYALWVPDLFMEALTAELAAAAARARGEAADPAAGDWHLFSPEQAPGLVDAYGGAFRALYARYVAEGRHARVVKASELMSAWFVTVAQKGNPYVLFKDHVNRKSNLAHYRTVTNSNLCVAGETLVLTDEGHVPIAELAARPGGRARVWNGAEWSDVEVARTAESAEVLAVEFEGGGRLVCTPDHKFYNRHGDEIRAAYLAQGTVLECPRRFPVVYGTGPDLDDQAAASRLYFSGMAAVLGVVRFVDNDAAYTPIRARMPRAADSDRLPLGAKTILRSAQESCGEGAGYVAAVATNPPINAAIGARLAWLAGFLDGMASNVNGGDLRLECPAPAANVLSKAVLLMQTLGVRPHVYAQKASFVLELSVNDVCGLASLGLPALVCESAKLTPRPPKGPKLACGGATIKRVERLPDKVPTYCFAEPKRHRGVFNGILTGQCAEITIPCFREEGRPEAAEYGTCNLAAIPLASFVGPAAAEGAGGDASGPRPASRVRWLDLARAVRAAARNLDAVVDLTYYPVEPCRRSNLKHRPLAIGVMGLADVFAALGLAYGSREACALDRALHAFIYYHAMAESAELGRAKGSHESFAGSPAAQGRLQPDLWVECGHLSANWAAEVEEATGGALAAADWDRLRAASRAHLRNAYVTADMPTATSSQVTGQNECFEPYTSNLYTRKTLAGEFTILNPHLFAELDRRGLWDDGMVRALIASGGSVRDAERFPAFARIPDDVRRRFRTARELDQRLLTRHAAARNPFLSQTQSLNYYFGEPRFRDALTVIVEGWRLGLTTGSYYIHTAPAVGAAEAALGLPQPAEALAAAGQAADAPVCNREAGCSSCAV